MKINSEIFKILADLGGEVPGVQWDFDWIDLRSISFNSVLYRNRSQNPWDTSAISELIPGIGNFISENLKLLTDDRVAFQKLLVEKYFVITEEPLGQYFWKPQIFSPFEEGTVDYKEWFEEFNDDELTMEEIRRVCRMEKPVFLQLFYSYGFPDYYFICLNNPISENPMVFSTDHEFFFREIKEEERLKDFLNSFVSPHKLMGIIEDAFK